MGTVACKINAELDGNRIIIECVQDEERASFVGSLPNARWDRGLIRWTCTATPAACWRVAGRADSDCCTGILERAELFASRNAEQMDQPPIRKRDSWQHQVAAYHFAYSGNATLLALAMGTGKSKVAIDLIQNRKCEKTLILCPMSVVRVWPDQFEQHAVTDFHIETLNAKSVAAKLKHAKDAATHAHYRNLPLVIICNYESAWRTELGEWIKNNLWDVVILDESHRIKSHDSAVSKFCGKLYHRSSFRLALTGTPLAMPADVFGQYRFLDPGLFGTSFHRFKSSYARMNPYIPQKVDEWINQDKLAELFGTIAYQVDASVLDLPEVLHEKRWIEMSPAAERAYSELEEDLIAEINEGTVTAANGLVKLLRLQQLTSGYIVDETTQNVIRVDHGKAEALREILEDSNEPVVVFCRFKEDLATVRDICATLHKEYGECSGSDKAGLSAEGRMNPDIDVLGCQIQSGGVGIDLTRARIAVYYSVGFDLLNFKQSLARVHRPGQSRPCIYYHLLAKGTVDPVIYGSLDKKDQIVDVVLKHLRER